MILYKSRISQVLDPSHRKWVQGGVFFDLRQTSSNFSAKPIYLPPPNSTLNLFKWVIRNSGLIFKKKILFSSITPLVNYYRFPIKVRKQKIGLWFTHQENDFSSIEKYSISKCNTIFIHSSREIEKLKIVSNAKLVITIGAIHPERFTNKANLGPGILWAGTPNERKRPALFLEIVAKNPNLNFTLIGNGWRSSKYWNQISSLKNINYKDFHGPLRSEDLDGCCIYLMTSEIEGGPMPLFESVASGLHPVCTDTGFVREIYNLINLPFEFVNPNVVEISEKLSSTLTKMQAGFSVEREQILKLDYVRLANIISNNL